ncbi:membrane protein [Helicobacter pylori]|nr:membrane protein [Helicobacter pylori]
MLGGFSSVLCAVLSVSVSVRSFCSCIACVISLSSLKLFSVSFVCSLFSFSFRIETPFFRRLVSLKMR